jgi:hypothetical protein
MIRLHCGVCYVATVIALSVAAAAGLWLTVTCIRRIVQ